VIAVGRWRHPFRTVCACGHEYGDHLQAFPHRCPLKRCACTRFVRPKSGVFFPQTERGYAQRPILAVARPSRADGAE
jgi:hypothetical protein